MLQLGWLRGWKRIKCSRENGLNEGANVTDEVPGDHYIFVEIRCLLVINSQKLENKDFSPQQSFFTLSLFVRGLKSC